MQIIQRTAQLHSPTDQLILCKWVFFFHQLLERFSRDIAHHCIDLSVYTQEIQNLRKICMMKILQNIYLLTVDLHIHTFFPQSFYDYLFFQPLVIRFVYDTAASFSELFQYHICI